MRASVVLLLGALLAAPLAAGCRGNFDDKPAEVPDAMPDAMLPELVCAVQSNPIPPLAGDLAKADLAVTSQDLRYLAAWVDPVTGVTAAQFDRTRTLTGVPRQLLPGGVVNVAGLEAVPERIWLVTATPPAQTVWSVASDLSTITPAITEQSIAGFESIAVASGTAAKPIWVRGGFADNTIRLSYLMSNGDVGAFTTFTGNSKITHLSFNDYTNHGHLGWRTEDGKCHSSDVSFGNQPNIPNQTKITDECTGFRVVSGPVPHDPLVMAWTNSAGDVFITYDGSTIPEGGTAFSVKIGTGRAPRITFDGELYWVAWRDDSGLRFASVDKTGFIKSSGLLGYFPISDESFELVARGVVVDLVVLDREKLTFMTLCNSAAN